MTDLFVYITKRIRRKRLAGRNSTADLYRASGNWFKRFCEKDCLSIRQLNASMVNDFENYLKNQGLKPNTVTSYLSSLKAIYNTACRDRLVSPVQHPFAGLKLRPEKTLKSAIPVDIMEQIAGLELTEKTGTATGCRPQHLRFHGMRHALRRYRKTEKGEHTRRHYRV